jgi:hypothetical protein
MIIPTAALAADSPTLKTGREVLPTHPAPPPIALRSIAKEVAPGYFELDPNAAQGKNIVLPLARGWVLCIGKRDKDGGCSGIYINTKDDPK